MARKTVYAFLAAAAVTSLVVTGASAQSDHLRQDIPASRSPSGARSVKRSCAWIRASPVPGFQIKLPGGSCPVAALARVGSPCKCPDPDGSPWGVNGKVVSRRSG
jgi:hypothetical protein